MIKDNKVHNSETNIYDATGDYLRVYKSGDNSFIKVLQDCKAYVLYTGTGAKAGEILQLAKDQLYQWNIQYTGIGVVIVL